MSDLAALLASGQVKEVLLLSNPDSELGKKVLVAARERLRLSKVLCQTCGGSGKVSRDIPSYPEYEFSSPDVVPCPACDGSGGEWPAELVEVVARKQYLTATGDDDWEDEVEYQPEYAEMSRILARAVLDAVESWMEAK